MNREELEKNIRHATGRCYQGSGKECAHERLKISGQEPQVDEIMQAVQEYTEYVIGKSPENPYGASDTFFQLWGAQASEYDKFIREEQRSRAGIGGTDE